MASVPSVLARSIGTYLVSVHKHCQLPFSPYLPQVKPKVSINTEVRKGSLGCYWKVINTNTVELNFYSENSKLTNIKHVFVNTQIHF